MAPTPDTGMNDDLSALAWVYDELRRSLENAHKALHRYLKEAEAAGASDVDAVDPSILRQARTQIHQSVGALELVGLGVAANPLRAAEAALNRLASRPRLINAAAVRAIEQGSFALLDFLARRLAGKQVSPLAMFPQYRALQELAGASRVHPADLWAHEWHWQAVAADPDVEPSQPDDRTIDRVEADLLPLMRGPAPNAAGRMSALFAGLGAGAEGHLSTLWKLAAAYFEAHALGLLPSDVYGKRVASRLLAQLRAGPQAEASERLAQDLLFFCAQVTPGGDARRPSPRLDAVRRAFGLEGAERIDYETARLGKFDPAWITQARKRVAAAKECWSAVAAGELARLSGLAEPFSLVGDSLQRLYADGDSLSQALQAAATQSINTSKEPTPELAMEVATALLYVDASLEDGDFDHPDMSQRVRRLAQRIDDVRSGRDPGPLERWMEDLYRRVSDRQTMGSVVQELRASLSEVEKQIDQYFRNPALRDVLIPVPAQLSSMRGVLSVLGMDQASQAVLRMRDDVDALASTEVDPARAAEVGTFDRLADNLGALSFLIDMVSVQPQLAKSLFRFDPATGNLSAVMTRAQRSGFGALDTVVDESSMLVEQAQSLVEAAARPGADAEQLAREIERLSQQARAADQPVLAEAASRAHSALAQATDEQSIETARQQLSESLDDYVAAQTEPLPLDTAPQRPVPPPGPPVAPGETGLEEDAEMREIFLEEAREVVETARAALGSLRDQPGDLEAMTTVRRAFHTLKGSSRMVGLTEFGEAGWACEQLYNARLADSALADPDLLGFSNEVLDHFEQWVAAIEAGQAGGFRHEPVSRAADALRLEGRRQPLHAPIAAVPTAAPAPLPPATLEPEFVLDIGEAPAPAPVPVESPPEFEAPALPALQLPPLDTIVSDLPQAADLDLSVPALPASALEPLPEFPAMAPTQPAGLDEPGFDLILPDTLDLAAVPAQPAPATDALVDLDLPVFDEPLPVAEVSTELPPALASALAPDLVPDLAADLTLDLGVEPPPGAPVPELGESLPEALDLSSLDLDALPLPEAAEQPTQAPVEAFEPGIAEPEAEQVKVIGDLRISIPLFNIYLNEADELSRRLSTELAEWAHEQHRAVGDSAVALAHSLAGSSATVGYIDLSQLARSLEHALMRSNDRGHGRDDEAEIFAAAAEEVRRLLHQFAAGFLRSADPELLHRLSDLEHAPLEPALAAELAAELPAELGASLLDETPVVPSVEHAAPSFEPAAEPSPETTAETAPGRAPEPEPEPVAETSPDTVAGDISTVLGDFGLPALKPFSALPEGAARPAPVRSDALDTDDDIDAVDAIDPELFPIFEEEGAELIPQLQSRLREWAAHPAEAAAASACMRTLHTLKGGARLAGAMHLGEMAHRLETAIEHLLAGAPPQAEDIEPLVGRADAIEAHFEALCRGGGIVPPTTPAEPTVEHPVQPLSGPVVEAAMEPLAETAPLPLVPAPQTAPAERPAPAPHTAREIDWSRFERGVALSSDAEAPRVGASTAAVRVRAPLLDRLVNHAGEVSITRARIESDVSQIKGALGDLTDNLERLRSQLRDIELQAETQIGTRMEAARAAALEFDPLEMDRFTRFQELTRMMAESVNDVATVQRGLQRTLQSAEDELATQARLTRDLQDDLLRTRMVEFEGLSERLYRVVRQAAKETGKQVRLDIIGGSIEIDRGVLDRMTGAFEHLLRNSVVHGIEAPQQRQDAGKEAAGGITVSVTQEGNEVGVEFRDDGAGLNLQRIREKAVATGLLAADAQPSDAELAGLIFHPGFSTASEVTGLAGRGVGMDVVRADVNAMGGRIETATAAGQGTSFKLVLPLTTAVTQVVMLRCADLTVAVPSTLVEIVRRATVAELEQAYRSGSMAVGEHELPFFWLGSLLQGTPLGVASGRTVPVLVIRSAAQRLVLHVDEVLGNQEVVVKNLGPQLSRLPGLTGMTLLPSGQPALIYNPVALATLYGATARTATVAALEAARRQADQVSQEPVAEKAPLVLVVDDSLTVRRVTQRLLQREGYRVTVAKDGLEGLERLADELPAVVLTDIEMPRMDGFDLVRNMRVDPRLAGLPVIMITSRIAQKHRDYAMELGVNHYLGKPFAEDELVALVANYAGHVTSS